jgi:hypothetical protein
MKESKAKEKQKGHSPDQRPLWVASEPLNSINANASSNGGGGIVVDGDICHGFRREVNSVFD